MAQWSGFEAEGQKPMWGLVCGTLPTFTTSPCDVSTGLCWVLIRHLQDGRIIFPTDIISPILRPQRQASWSSPEPQPCPCFCSYGPSGEASLSETLALWHNGEKLEAKGKMTGFCGEERQMAWREGPGLRIRSSDT